ncbi:hypothetical protein Syun_001995 [Stephania yunnanensis]|uniref:Folylpolyglutamate synthase n=1 Tax=Stephania yunnanensis TaxID=152371 RepID=A0AAP0Q710_9MAGN
MLVNVNSFPRHDIYAAPSINKRQKLSFTIKTRTTPSYNAEQFMHDHIVLSLRHKTLISHVIKDMGSDGILETKAYDPSLYSYETAMEALSSLITRKKRGEPSTIVEKYGKLDRMQMYVEILGIKEEHMAELKIIHVAGTKGKGSTCVFSESILRECGFRTGLFISPHLIDVRERFRIDGLEISEDKFLNYFWECWHRLKENLLKDLPMPPLFQFLTVLALKIFICEKVDVAIIEVGLGGKDDSTNVIKKPVVCGISSLGMDHMEILGNTLEEIASHKAGIFKPLIPAFTVYQPSEAINVLKKRAFELTVPLDVVSPLDPKELKGVELGLAGDHQFINAALAIALCKCWLQETGNMKDYFQNKNSRSNLPEPFSRGLSTAHLSGRAQIVYDASVKSCKLLDEQENSSGDLIFYLDGAHSPESMEACARWFSKAVKESESSRFEIIGESVENSGRSLERENLHSRKTSKQFLLFNCMEVRNPHVLLPQIVNNCASSGVHFSKAIFAPTMSKYNKVTSAASHVSSDTATENLSWQFSLQKLWEKLTLGKDAAINLESNKTTTFSPDVDASQKLISLNNHSGSTAVFPSLPSTIKWLRDTVRRDPSLRLQVLVTGSLHLVGDVLKLLKR